MEVFLHSIHSDHIASPPIISLSYPITMSNFPQLRLARGRATAEGPKFLPRTRVALPPFLEKINPFGKLRINKKAHGVTSSVGLDKSVDGDKQDFNYFACSVPPESELLARDALKVAQGNS